MFLPFSSITCLVILPNVPRTDPMDDILSSIIKGDQTWQGKRVVVPPTAATIAEAEAEPAV